MIPLIKTGKALLAAALLGGMSPAWGAAEITVTAKPNPMSEEDNLTLRIEVTLDGTEQVGKPAFSAPDFDIVGQSNSLAAESRLINGKFTYQRRHQYSFILYPRKSGSLKIAELSVPVGNDTLKSEDITVYVRGSGGAPRPDPVPAPGADDEEGINPAAPRTAPGLPAEHPREFNSDFTVHLQVNKRSVYVGEPIVAEYYLYDTNNIVAADIKRWPSFEGFWKEDLQIASRIDFEPVWAGNRQMRRALIGRYALYPGRPGKLRLPQLLIQANYLWRNEDRAGADPFARFFSRADTRSATHSNPEVAVEVLALPDIGKPENFSGAVGNFSLKFSADKSTVAINTPLQLTLELEGEGNLQAVEGMKLKLPPDFELYESNSTKKTGAAGSLHAKRTFTYLLLPRKPGKFTLPAMKWSYFDPKKREYVSLSTAAVNVEVTGTASAGSVNPGMPAPNEAPAPAAQQELLYLKSVDELLKPASIFSRQPFWTLNAFLAALVAALAAWRGWNPLRTLLELQARRSSPKRKLNKALARLDGRFKDRAEYYGSLLAGLHAILEARYGKPVTGMTRDEIEQEWRNAKLPATTYQRLSRLLDECEKNRYSSSSSSAFNPDARGRDLQEVRLILKEMQL